MAILRTPEALGQRPVPAVNEVGDVKEILIKWDASATNIASGDYINLMFIPADAVITNVRVASSATTGTATVAVGIATVTAGTEDTITGLATTFVSAAAITTTAVSGPINTIFTDVPSSKNNRVLAAAVATAGITSPTLYFAIQYRAARYGV